MKWIIGIVALATVACHRSHEPDAMIRIPAGIAQGDALPCSNERQVVWVDEFEIDRIPVYFQDYTAWADAPASPAERAFRHPNGAPFGFANLLVERAEAARAYCESRGLDVPTLAELWRATRWSKEVYPWGTSWSSAPSCPDGWDRHGDHETGLCLWTSPTGVVFPLDRPPDDTPPQEDARPFSSELVASPCPGDALLPVDLTGAFLEPDTTWIRCVRRKSPPARPPEVPKSPTSRPALDREHDLPSVDTGIVALDDGGAVIHRTREGRRELARLTPRGVVSWTNWLAHPVEREGLALRDDVIVVRERPRDASARDAWADPIELEAFDLEQGRRRWRTPLAAPAGWKRTEHPRLSGPGELVEIVTGVDRSAVTLIAASSGRVRRQRELPFVRDGGVDGSRIWLRAGDTTYVAAGADLRPLPGLPCGRGVSLVVDGATARLRPDGRDQAAFAELPAPAHNRMACTTYGDSFLISIYDDDRGTRLTKLARDGRREGALTITSGPLRCLSDVPPSLPTAPLAGRYLPFVVGEQCLALLDLERMSLRWSRQLDGETTAFRHGRSWYVIQEPRRSRTRGSTRVAVIDGETGEITAAAHIQAWDGVREIRPSNVAGGSLWLSGRGDRLPDTIVVARLDAATLAPIYLHGGFRIVPDPDWLRDRARATPRR